MKNKISIKTENVIIAKACIRILIIFSLKNRKVKKKYIMIII